MTKGIRLLFLALAAALTASGQTLRFDVVVYGGTAGGAVAAVTAAREGLKTALLEPGAHIGGMVSGGLGFTDYGKQEVIGGTALEFYFRAGRHYHMRDYGLDVAWYLEPHVAEQILRDMLHEARVTVFEHARLREKDGARKRGTMVEAIATESGAVFEARVFLDSSYEGDLMAQAGVGYTWGREASSLYGESLAGVRDRTPLHQFLVDVPARDAAGALLAEVSGARPAVPGSADKAVQAYNYRVCLTDVTSNRVALAAPQHYDARRYELLARLIEARTRAESHAPALGTLLKIDRIPNGKTDVNNQGAFSTDYIGGSWRYPEAGYAERERIAAAHRDYQAGLFYFLANDTRMPAPLRGEMSRWGLCADEFTDTGHWPHQLYIREARRMVGEYVVTQKDLQTDLTKPDPIGMGSYNSDSHNVERIVDEAGFARNEGDMQVAVKPYQIPYRVLLPRREQATNLLVPVAFSASHVAYSSLRMEPQYMILGQAAGVAAAMAVRGNTAVQEIDAAALAARLRKQGAVLEYVPSAHAPALRLFLRRFDPEVLPPAERESR